MSQLSKLLEMTIIESSESANIRHDYVEKERRRAEKLLKSKGFEKVSHNKDKYGEWTHSVFSHGEKPQDVILSRARHPITGNTFLNIIHTKKSHTKLSGVDDLENHLNKSDAPAKKKHFWNR